MGRGGGYFIVSFLAGAITAACIFKIAGTSIPLVCPILLAAISAALFTIASCTGHLAQIKKHLLLLGYLAMFFTGFSNMYRCGKSDKHPSETTIRARQFIENKISASITHPQDRAVLTAMVTGDRSQINSATKEAYKNSGAMHILALSGLHIGIIYTLLNSLLFFLNRTIFSRQIKLLICAACLFAYAAMTGFSPSVQRAAIMIVTHKLLDWGGRKKGKWDVMLLSAAIIIILHPSQLMEPGFQLSYAAVFGIIAIYPTINSACGLWKKWRFAKAANAVWSLMAISVSCQIATAPLSLYYFNSLPHPFPLTNILVIPLVSITLYLVPITFFSEYIPVVGEWLQVLPGHILRLMNYFINLIGN